MVSHQPAKFGAHRHCGSECIMVLVYHMISEDHAAKDNGDKMVLVCQKILQNHVTK